jgi:hypothetical protein
VFENTGSGTITANTTSASLFGTGTAFLTALKKGDSLSVSSGTFLETRRIVSIESNTVCTLDRPFSATVTSFTYTIRYTTGKGYVSNDGTFNTLVGTNTTFTRDLSTGWVVAVGSQKLLVTSIINDTRLTLNGAFNPAKGGITMSAWTFDACLANTISQQTYSIDTCELKPGCCGFKLSAAVLPQNFAYYTIKPPHANMDIRVVMSSVSPDLDLFVQRSNPPDEDHYDYKAVGGSSPWQLEMPRFRVSCNASATPGGSPECEPIVIGIKGLGNALTDVSYQLAAFAEMNFASFSCGEMNANSLSSRCDSLGLKQLGNASVVQHTAGSSSPSGKGKIQLTPELNSQTGALWWGTKVHLENGFETSFDFSITSACSASADQCGTGDGFAFVLYGGADPDQIGCGGRAMGFANDVASNCTGGIPMSFAVEFDTWHNPELHDINLRGSGVVTVNATQVARYSYAHAAFFSQGGEPNTVSHTEQLAGTPAIPEISDGKTHHAKLVYIPGSTAEAPGRMFLYVDDMQSFVLTAPIRLARQTSFCSAGSRTHRCILDAFGNAYIGFTSATGGVGQVHEIHDWIFCDEPNCGR